MSHSYTSNRIHIIFSTKGRRKSLSPDFQPKLWAYMAGIAKNHGFLAITIGGTDDHCHCLIALPGPMPLSKAVQTLKGCSSKWINDTVVADGKFAWQEGYGAFSVSASQTLGVIAYIRNQPEHHKKRDFELEFVEFLKKYGVTFDPAHVMG